MLPASQESGEAARGGALTARPPATQRQPSWVDGHLAGHGFWHPSLRLLNPPSMKTSSELVAPVAHRTLPTPHKESGALLNPWVLGTRLLGAVGLERGSAPREAQGVPMRGTHQWTMRCRLLSARPGVERVLVCRPGSRLSQELTRSHSPSCHGQGPQTRTRLTGTSFHQAARGLGKRHGHSGE